jgi:hypothetical protein
MERKDVRPIHACVPLVALAIAVGGCAKTEKSENPLSPQIAGPMPGVEISAPVLIEPGRGWRLKSNEQPVQLMIENAATNGPRPLLYRFEVAADGGFLNIVYAREGIAQGEGGQTGRTLHRLPDRLADGRTYFWRARAYDGANTGPFQVGLNFEIQHPSRLFNPQLLEPVNGQTSTSERPHLKVRNAARQGPILNVNYAFQVAADPGFTQVLAQGSVPENTVTGETIWLPTAELPAQTTTYWRSMASDGLVSSGWEASLFKTPSKPTVPGPGPGPKPISCGSPATHYDVVSCQRSAYGTPIGHNNLSALMRAIAADLNRRGFSGGPFGVLKKTGGDNCGGISCDIVCAGPNNFSQHHYDVLIDGTGAGVPTWGPPRTGQGNIRPDECLIQ